MSFIIMISDLVAVLRQMADTYKSLLNLKLKSWAYKLTFQCCLNHIPVLIPKASG